MTLYRNGDIMFVHLRWPQKRWWLLETRFVRENWQPKKIIVTLPERYRSITSHKGRKVFAAEVAELGGQLCFVPTGVRVTTWRNTITGGERRKQYHAHLSDEEHALVKQAARRRGVKVSTYLRELALADAKRVLAEAGAAVPEPKRAQSITANSKRKPQTDWLAKAREAVANG